MKRFNWENIRLLLIFIAIGFLYAFSANRNEHRALRKSEVKFDRTENLFVTPEAVNKLLIEKNRASETVGKENLDLNKLEKTVNAHEMVEESEVYVSVDGVLKAKVKQKTPIVRVFGATGSFYIDYNGKTMPLSELYTARVPLVSGAVDPKKPELMNVFRSINDDDFLKKNIIGIKVLENGSLVMKNRNYAYEIDFGKPIHVERKFKNYKAFFQKAALDSTINNYKRINLIFTKQVVCSK